MIRTIAALICLVITCAANASIYQGAVVDFEGFNVASSAPGSPFTLDYRPFIPGGAPYQLSEVSLDFADPFRPFTHVSIQLDSSPTVFNYFSIAPQHTSVLYDLYDPQFIQTPGGPYPAMPAYELLPQEWRDEAADGVISGHLWIDNSSTGFDQFTLAVNSVFAVPEPTVALVGLALLVARRRRLARRFHA